MGSAFRMAHVVLVLGFLVVITGVPLSQITVEIVRNEPVQATDLFRYPPTVENLRDFERALEDSWWGQRTIRPATHCVMYHALGDTGTKALGGHAGWLFYRPGVHYLIESDRHAEVVAAIARVRDQLKQRSIGLLVVPAPGKASVYPERLTRRFAGIHHTFRSPTEAFLEALQRHGVKTVDLFAVFRQARRSKPPGPSLYLAQDTHWTPAGARLAAGAVARKLRDLGWSAGRPWKYTTERTRVARRGDIATMMQLPAVHDTFPAEVVDATKILDPMAGPMVPPEGGRPGTFQNAHLIDTPFESSILLIGDSFSRIYQSAEPASLNASTHNHHRKKRLLPGSAGFPSLLAWELKAPVDYIVSDGGAATDVRQRLCVNPEILQNKTIVIWEFAERDIQLGGEGWASVPLPPRS